MVALCTKVNTRSTAVIFENCTFITGDVDSACTFRRLDEPLEAFLTFIETIFRANSTESGALLTSIAHKNHARRACLIKDTFSISILNYEPFETFFARCRIGRTAYLAIARLASWAFSLEQSKPFHADFTGSSILAMAALTQLSLALNACCTDQIICRHAFLTDVIVRRFAFCAV